MVSEVGSKLAVALFTLFLFSGCGEKGSVVESFDSRNYAPASFIEGELDVARLERFLMGNALFLPDCSQRSLKSEMIDTINRSHLAATTLILYHCHFATQANRTLLTEIAIEEGSENATFSELKAQAQLKLDAAFAAIDQRNVGVANYVDLQVLAHLMNQYKTFHDQIESADKLMAIYWSENDKLALQNAYGKLLSVVDGANILRKFMESFPWVKGGSCTLPEGLYQEVLMQYSKTESLASGVSDPEDAQWLSTMYGKLVGGIQPILNFHIELGWWPAVLKWKGELSWDHAYWENFSAGNNADPKEALLIISKYRNNTRTLMTENQLDFNLARAEDAINSGFLWTDTLGITSFSVPALEWSYQEATCPGNDVH